jgi:hypothetical protein
MLAFDPKRTFFCWRTALTSTTGETRRRWRPRSRRPSANSATSCGRHSRPSCGDNDLTVGGNIGMLKWVRRIAGATICTVLVAMILGPWALYWLALTKVVGRPSHALEATFATEDAEALWRQLREPMPVRVEPMSPYSYLWPVLRCSVAGPWRCYGDGDRWLPRGGALAEMVATSHNRKNFPGLGWWHFSGAALSIWLTRNWTTDELIAKGIELNRTRKPRVAH